MHLAVLVPGPQDPAVALFDVGGPPRGVEVMQRHEAVLDVRPDAHLVGRTDQHRDLAVTSLGEQPGLGVGVAGFVNEPDHPRRYPPLGEQVAEVFVDTPAGPVGGTDVAEHDLQRPRPRMLAPGAGIVVAVVAVPVVDRGDLVGARVDLAGGRPRGLVDEAEVERGAASVAGDGEHVVLVGSHRALTDLFGPFHQCRDVVGEFG